MRRLSALDVLCVVLIAAGLAAWTCGIRHRYFDYDELEHLYALWRVHAGDRPFVDFFEGHPPFLWYLLAPGLPAYDLFSFPLFPLRVLTAAGHLVFLLALGRNVALSFARLARPVSFPRAAFIVGTLVLAGNPSVIWYLVEFRLDAWPNALLLLAIDRYRRTAAPPLRAAFALAFVGTLTLLCTPKLALLLVLFCLCSLAAGDARGRRAAGLAAGTLAALLAGALFLRAAGLDLRLVYALCVRYHRLLGARGGFGHGMAAAILGQPPLVAFAAAALAGWLLVARRRLAAQPFELSVALFLVVQPIVVPFGFPQYYAPWFLLAIAFVPWLELGLRQAPAVRRLAGTAALVLAGATLVVDLRTFLAVDQTAPVVAFNAWAHARVPAGATVAGDVAHLPIYRRAVFYHLADSRQPNGYTTEAALADLHLGELGARMTPAAYDRELEAGRPALIVPGPLLSPPENEAVARYLARHRSAYGALASPAGPVELRR
ncbi:MAG TPA: hypothetical protein VHO06_06040 [Polyangia bacterium]|nr:hypothetical protein [Polyangia bacterium]